MYSTTCLLQISQLSQANAPEATQSRAVEYTSEFNTSVAFEGWPTMPHPSSRLKGKTICLNKCKVAYYTEQALVILKLVLQLKKIWYYSNNSAIASPQIPSLPRNVRQLDTMIGTCTINVMSLLPYWTRAGFWRLLDGQIFCWCMLLILYLRYFACSCHILLSHWYFFIRFFCACVPCLQKCWLTLARYISKYYDCEKTAY